MVYYVYILQCADGSYYTGFTTNLKARMRAHHNGYDHRAYTFCRRPLKLVWSEKFDNLDEAVTLEQKIKKFSRARKEAFIKQASSE